MLADRGYFNDQKTLECERAGIVPHSTALEGNEDASRPLFRAELELMLVKIVCGSRRIFWNIRSTGRNQP